MATVEELRQQNRELEKKIEEMGKKIEDMDAQHQRERGKLEYKLAQALRKLGEHRRRKKAARLGA